MKKGLVFSRKESYPRHDADRVVAEAQGRGILVDRVFYEDLNVFLGDGEIIFYANDGEINLSRYAWAFFSSSSWKGQNFIEAKTAILLQLLRENVHVLNGETFEKYPKFSKLLQHCLFSNYNIPGISSWYTSKSERPKSMKNFQMPLIAKKVYGSRGEGVYKLTGWDDFGLISSQYYRDGWLIQDFKKAKEDLRVVVLNGKVLGAMYRVAKFALDKKLISKQHRFRRADIDEKISNLCLFVAQSLNVDFAGIDVIFDHNNKPYILELNRHAHFKRIEKTSKINVAGKIVDFLIQSI